MPDAKPLLDERVSETIRIARVLCIFFMMLVHVPPGFDGYAELVKDEPSLIGLIQIVFTGIFGRSSVPLLSIISGYLAVYSLSRYGYTKYAYSRFMTLYLPVIFWNSLLLFFALSAAHFLGVSTTSYEAVAGFSAAKMIYGAVLNIDDSGITIALNFLRDLFICGLLLPVLLPMARRFPLISLPALVIISSAGFLEPLIFRPAIIQFFFLGVILHFHKKPIAEIPRYSAILYSLLALVSVAHILHFFDIIALDIFLVGRTDTFITIKQLVVALAMWCFCFWFAQFDFSKRLKPFEKIAFLAYLSHVFVFGIAWFIWQRLIGDNVTSTLYMVFFFGAPIGLLLTAPFADRLLAHLPSYLQIPIKGKVTRLKPDRVKNVD